MGVRFPIDTVRRWAGSAKGAIVRLARGVATLALWAVRHPRTRAVAPALGRIGRSALLGGLVGAAAVGLGAACLERVPPGVVAVRLRKLGGQGVVERDYGVGLHLGFPGRDQWHRLRAGVHVINFAWASEGGSQPMLEVATKDGEAVSVAVSVLYRIRAGEAWELVATGLKNDYPRRATAIARRVLLEELGQLTTEGFSSTDVRAAARAAARERLDLELAASHLQVLDLRFGSVFFDSGYEKKMQEKQLAAQVEQTNISIEARKRQELEYQQRQHEMAEQERALREEVRSAFLARHLDLERQVGEVGGGAEDTAARLRFEARAEAERLVVVGELALTRAEAEREGARNEALSGAGGRLYLAREAARRLRFAGITLDARDPATPNPLDLDRLLPLLIGGRQ
jgi:SPFH domain / Band 7 family